MEALLEKIEEARLIKAESRVKDFDHETAINFEDFVKEQGFDMGELLGADSVEIE